MIKNRYAVLIAYSGDICSSPVICLIIVSVFRILETFSVQVPLWELNRFASGYIVRVAQNGNCFCLKKGLWYKPKCTFVGDGKFGLGTYSLNIKVRKPVSPHLGLCVSENVANRGSGMDWRWCQETYAITKTGSVVIFLSFFFFLRDTGEEVLFPLLLLTTTSSGLPCFHSFYRPYASHALCGLVYTGNC